MARRLTWTTATLMAGVIGGVLGSVPGGILVGVAASQTWRLHATIEGERPFLCKDADSIGMVVDIAARAQEARARRDTEKAERLLDLASRLQGEICRRPSPDDVIVLRCRVQSRTIAGVAISTVKVSALLRAEPSLGEQPFFAWKAGEIEDASPGEETTKANSRWCEAAHPPGR